MPNYIVRVKETTTYLVEVEADNEENAQTLAVNNVQYGNYYGDIDYTSKILQINTPSQSIKQ